jgi:flavin prenyltransferase
LGVYKNHGTAGIALFLIVGISGASSAVYGVRLLDALRVAKIPAHLIVPKLAAETLKKEARLSVGEVRTLAAAGGAAGIGLNHFSGQMPNSLKALIAPGW